MIWEKKGNFIPTSPPSGKQTDNRINSKSDQPTIEFMASIEYYNNNNNNNPIGETNKQKKNSEFDGIHYDDSFFSFGNNNNNDDYRLFVLPFTQFTEEKKTIQLHHH